MMKKLFTSLTVALFGVLVFAPSASLAMDYFNTGGAGNELGLKMKGEVKIAEIINTILSYIGLVAVVIFIIGGIMYMVGNTDGGKSTMSAAAIGLVAVLLSYAAVGLIVKMFGAG